MSGIRESLAGRSVSRELFPFVVEELAGSQSRVLKAIFQASTNNQVISELVNDLKQVLQTTPEVYAIQRAEEHLMAFGGMPYLMHLDNEDERWLWLAALSSRPRLYSTDLGIQSVLSGSFGFAIPLWMLWV